MGDEIPSQGIINLYEANITAGRTKVTDNLLIRFPSLKGSEPKKVAENAFEGVVEPVAKPIKKESSHGKARKR